MSDNQYTTESSEVQDFHRKLMFAAVKNDGKRVRQLFHQLPRIGDKPIADGQRAPDGIRVVNMRDQFGFTPLQAAAFAGSANAVKALLEREETDVTARTPHGCEEYGGVMADCGNKTALQLADIQRHTEVSDLINDDGRDTQALNSFPKTPRGGDARRPAALEKLGQATVGGTTRTLRGQPKAR